VSGRDAALEAIEWADVIQWFMRTPPWQCPDCPFETQWEAVAKQHAEASGHAVFPSDITLRLLWPQAVRRLDKAIVIDADDLVAEWKPWYLPPELRDVQPWDRPLAAADLVTVSTPRLERVARAFNPRTRIIRNTVEPSQFTTDLPRPEGPTRLTWYAFHDRLGDWSGSYCHRAADDHRKDLRTVYLGAIGPAQFAEVRSAGFDEAWPAVPYQEWPRTLASSYPEIGVAPLRLDRWSSCKSELHWLEFAACGAPSVLERSSGPGPYDVVRDGVDGFLARGRQEWHDAIGRLAGSAQLREDIGSAARERILADYSPSKRVDELADSYRWAAEHPGINSKRGQLLAGSAHLPHIATLR
jgi:hypothetical protein